MKNKDISSAKFLLKTLSKDCFEDKPDFLQLGDVIIGSKSGIVAYIDCGHPYDLNRHSLEGDKIIKRSLIRKDMVEILERLKPKFSNDDWKMKYPKEIRHRIGKNKAYGDLIELEKFVDFVESACIIDYDGHGYPSDGEVYLKPEGLSTFKIYDLLEETNPNNKNKKWNWTHIIWFNK